MTFWLAPRNCKRRCDEASAHAAVKFAAEGGGGAVKFAAEGGDEASAHASVKFAEGGK
ncbi:MAG: hypothetical protein IKC32_06960 [Clostridia bacterium]|nr:hypothetical protein [Clostridia bacterium]